MRKHWIIATLIAMVLFLSVKTDAFANNDSFSTAEAIELNTVKTDSMADYNDKNYYVINLPADGYISCTFSRGHQNNNNELWRLIVYNKDEQELLEDAFDGISTSDTTSELGLAEGVYYVRIKANGSGSYFSNATYSLKVNYTQSSYWEKEINDDTAQNNRINVNTKVFGSSSDYNDKDYYSIMLNEDGFMSINFERALLNNNNDIWILDLYDSNNEEILERQFDGITRSNTTAEVGLKKGYYLIRIKPNGSGSYYSSTTYAFTLNFKAADNWEKELNDSEIEATTISIDKTFYGSTVDHSDKDYYVLRLNEAKNLSFVFNRPNLNLGNNLWIVRISDAKNNEIAEYLYDGTTVTTKSGYISYPAGLYYVRVKSNGSGSYHSDKTYSFSLESMIDVTGIKLSANTLTLKTGESAALTAEVIPANASIKTVNWSSSNPNVASVSGGVVTGWNVGKATIYAKSWDGVVSAACEVTVYSTIKTIGKITYDFNNETSEATVVGVKSTSKIKIPGTVKDSGRTYKVTAIAKNAMKNNKKITELDIADSVRSIGDNACSGCSKLKVVKLNGNNISIGKNAFRKIKKKATFKIKAKTKSKAKKFLKTINKKGGAKNAKLKHIKG